MDQVLLDYADGVITDFVTYEWLTWSQSRCVALQ